MKTNTTVVVLSMILVAILSVVLGATAFSTQETKVVYVNNTIEKVVEVPANSTIQDLAAEKILENDNFEDVALDLALSELNDRNFKDLFKYLDNKGYNITEKEDIDRIKVTDSTVSNIDVDDQDAKVEIEFRVYYEDEDGQDLREDLIVKYKIVDGEVDNTNFQVA